MFNLFGNMKAASGYEWLLELIVTRHWSDVNFISKVVFTWDIMSMTRSCSIFFNNVQSKITKE